MVRPKYVVVADGANSRFGRALGTSANRTYPLGMALRGYSLRRHDDPLIESHLDIRDKADNGCPATAGSSRWATAGSTWASGCSPPSARWKGVNTSHLMDGFVRPPPRPGDSPPRRRRPANRGQAPDGRLGRPAGRSQLGDRGRRRRVDQPVQRRGHRDTGTRRAGWPTGRRPRPADRRGCWPCRYEQHSTRSTASTFARPALREVIGNPAVMRELTGSACTRRP